MRRAWRSCSSTCTRAESSTGACPAPQAPPILPACPRFGDVGITSRPAHVNLSGVLRCECPACGAVYRWVPRPAGPPLTHVLHSTASESHQITEHCDKASRAWQLLPSQVHLRALTLHVQLAWHLV